MKILCFVFLLASFTVQAFIRCNSNGHALAINRKICDSSDMALNGIRRNNKIEKRKRNREYARKYRIADGLSRKKQVAKEKRAQIALTEEKFQAQVFSLTTDEDMPEYTGFDFLEN